MASNIPKHNKVGSLVREFIVLESNFIADIHEEKNVHALPLLPLN